MRSAEPRGIFVFPSNQFPARAGLRPRSSLSAPAMILVWLLCAAMLPRGFAVEAHGKPKPAPREAAGLHHVFQIDAALYSGSSPASDEAFHALARLGVKLLISVDGAKPAVTLARKHGMRYVHLPIGYDGVPAARAAQLLKAASIAEGAVYVHCHHGKHRGPAAVAIIGRGLRDWSVDDAALWLQLAGTGPEYSGLHRDAREFHRPSAAELAAIPAELPELAETPPMIDRMVSLDAFLDELKAQQKAGWATGRAPEGPTDPGTLLWEELRELQRHQASAERGADYAALLAKAENAARRLRAALRADAFDPRAKDAALKMVSASCAACHRRHRD